MVKNIQILNCLSGVLEEYSSPPWRLKGISAHSRGSLVRLVDDQGSEIIIPVMMQSEFLGEIFFKWPRE